MANFGVPTAVTELNTSAQQDGARITPNGLELYLTRTLATDAKFKKVHHYNRVTAQSPWQVVGVENALTVPVENNTEADSGFLTFVDDRTAYLSILQGGGTVTAGGYRESYTLAKTTRAAPGDPWGAPVPISNIITTARATSEHPWFDGITSKLYFMSGSAGSYRIYVADVVGALVQPSTALGTNLDVGLTLNQYAPVLSRDGTTFYFTGTPGRVIFKSARSGAGFFGTVKEPTLNKAGTVNQLTWISPDSCEVYLTVDGMIHKARRPN
jgi:hypothetical protein